MDTYFAPSEKANKEKLAAEIDFVSNNQLMSALLHSISGLLAVLDQPAVHGKNIDFSENIPSVSIRPDISLLLRILCKMIINAWKQPLKTEW